MELPDTPGTPPTWKLMLVKWLGLLPVLFAVAYALDALPGELPLWGTLLIETSIVVPLLSYVITPVMDHLVADWLYAGVDGSRSSSNIGS